ncbi:dermonecrotic toxin domain-containing protein [Pseudomonas sp.]|uniref:dermonecrotic toxin domain-containing protein n=1 Tax=Pseudomonas sp. TaxID=306 RepID=UPI002E35B905|nr:DUF6543 domain-containing protein [Pseudomonas sp.]HEX4550014.1 DUF6543 domain-containing protein [Pseudomonas sp.]
MPWYANAPRNQHDTLQSLIAAHWQAQNAIDEKLKALQDIQAFAEPLLKQAIKDRFGIEPDVNQTFLRLYVPQSLSWFAIKHGTRAWTVSLLAAALHNFEPGEAEDDAFDAGSTFITPPTATGQFEALPAIHAAMTPQDFIKLCRDLDIGGRYQAHLEDNLGVGNPAAAAAMQTRVNASQSSALKAALQMALMKNDIGDATHRVILGLLDGVQGVRLHGHAWHCHDLRMMSADLTGILLFAPDLEQIRETARVVVYIPDDPEHPVKEYASSAAFTADLSERLRKADYQKFFSRFVAHGQRETFIAQLNQRQSRITWHPHERGDPRPVWRETEIEKPNLQLSATRITQNLQQHLFERALNKILNDAQTIAVSTASADRKARWAAWDAFSKIGMTLVGIAAMLVAPFVPLVGEAMLAYMAYQLLDETFEGIVDWSQGQTRQAFTHLIGVVQSLIQLGLFATGAAFIGKQLVELLPNEVVAFFDGLKAVAGPGGKTRYWKPDLAPYAQKTSLPRGKSVDGKGLYAHEGKSLLPLGEQLFSVTRVSADGPYRIEHPTRPDAYRPRLDYIDDGVWMTELDKPLDWDRSTLLKHAGPRASSLSASERELALNISGHHENHLRKARFERKPLPPLLHDSMVRIGLDKDIHTFIEQMRSEAPEDYLRADWKTQLQLLTQNMLWPENKGLRLLNSDGETLWESANASSSPLNLHQSQEGNTDLLFTLLRQLDETQIKTLLEEDRGAPPSAITVRTHALRQKLANIAENKKTSMFDERYRVLDRIASPQVQAIIDTAPGLPASVASEIFDMATSVELSQLKHRSVPERLTHIARWARQEVRLSRAYEGLYLDAAPNLDSDVLALYSLEKLRDWPAGIRLEIREFSYAGRLRESIGEADAAVRKVLVLREDGWYEPYDENNLALSSSSDFFDSLLRALPDEARNALDIHIGEGPKLRKALQEHALDRDTLRTLLSRTPLLKPAYDPSVMRLPGGADGYERTPPDSTPLKQLAQELYPALHESQLQDLVTQLEALPGGARNELYRLHAELNQLKTDLDAWIAQSPRFDPLTGARLRVEDYVEARNNRSRFAEELKRCWRKETPVESVDPETGVLGYELRFSNTLIGDLPMLTANMPHATSLIIEDSPQASGISELLAILPRLQNVEIRRCILVQFPEALTRLPELNQLTLSECAITLTPTTQQTLASLHTLTTLDLHGNPLTLLPDITAMPDLEFLDVSSTGIAQLPAGLIDHPKIDVAIFSGNQFIDIPQAILERPGKMTKGLDFGNNPLSDACREKVKVYYQLNGHDLGVLAEMAEIVRVKALYPTMDNERANDFIYRLPGTLESGRQKVTRLPAEYQRLTTELAAWTGNVPALNPYTGLPFTAQELSDEHFFRDDFKARVEACWRRESPPYDLDNDLQPPFELEVQDSPSGDLPVLSADFSHVAILDLEGFNGITSGAGPFLGRFPKLKSLFIQQYTLGDIPDEIFNMGELASLTLMECEITLTERTANALSEMTKLETLNLSQNPLGLTPDLSQMSELSVLTLEDTGITEIPRGLFQLPALYMADLSHNAIVNIPADIFELPPMIADGIDLAANPLSPDSLQRISAYFGQTGSHFNVRVVLGMGEMQVSDAEP